MADAQSREAFLGESNVAVFSSVGPGGSPHAVPLWYLYEDGVFRISVGEGSQKHRNVQRDGRVALVIDRRTRPYYSLTVMGSATIGPGFTPAERLQLATHYLGEVEGQRFVESKPAAPSVSIRFTADRYIEYDPPAI